MAATATAMTNAELDPHFVKALKLLRSRNKDSTDQLKKMLDDVLAQRRPEGRRDEDHEPKSFSKLSSKREKEEQMRKREAEKRHLEKLQQDISELSAQPAKKSRLDSGEKDWDRERSRDKERKSHDDKSRDDKKDRDGDRKERKRPVIIDSSSESESESTEDEKGAASKIDADEFALDLGDLACVVCKQMDVTSGNNLVECQDCHSLYHQECHRPPVTEEIIDPRYVWYCHRCEKTMKRMANKSSKSKSSSSQPMKEVLKSSKPEPLGLVQPFRRMEPAKPASSKESSSSSGSRPLGGLASLAANLSTKEGSKAPNPSSKESSKSAKEANPSSKESSKAVKESSLFAAALSADLPTKPAKSSKSESSSSSSKSSSKDSHKSSSSSGSSKSSSAQKSSSSSSSSSKSQSSMMSADKRLQLMKKKAASKVHDKRK